MSSIIEINLDKYEIYFTPTEIAVHPDDGVGRLQYTLGPGYIPPIWSAGRCPPNVRFADVVTDPTVAPGACPGAAPRWRLRDAYVGALVGLRLPRLPRSV